MLVTQRSVACSHNPIPHHCLRGGRKSIYCMTLFTGVLTEVWLCVNINRLYQTRDLKNELFSVVDYLLVTPRSLQRQPPSAVNKPQILLLPVNRWHCMSVRHSRCFLSYFHVMPNAWPPYGKLFASAEHLITWHHMLQGCARLELKSGLNRRVNAPICVNATSGSDTQNRPLGGRAGPLPRALTSRGRRKGSHRPVTP
jgi:hypothetical protein